MRDTKKEKYGSVRTVRVRTDPYGPASSFFQLGRHPDNLRLWLRHMMNSLCGAEERFRLRQPTSRSGRGSGRQRRRRSRRYYVEEVDVSI